MCTCLRIIPHPVVCDDFYAATSSLECSCFGSAAQRWGPGRGTVERAAGCRYTLPPLALLGAIAQVEKLYSWVSMRTCMRRTRAAGLVPVTLPEGIALCGLGSLCSLSGFRK
mmetsp:Transcript_14616/g.44632  ORF Transcript_14616/g.44632 Transcript_14616/m.44632 type:complete len:112 (-) Transcript_14616:404-739(-)